MVILLAVKTSPLLIFLAATIFLQAISAILREAADTGKPIQWVQIHRLPDFVYFSHQAHLSAGVSCVSCHGRIDQMIEVKQEKS